ncbi:MAG: ATP-binding cassette domain-containing protein [Afipia sp.]|nr:ATP-binding cassette domain-containing protein [Afipia sp.]
MSNHRIPGALALRNVTIKLGAATLVNALDLTVAPGGVATVMGPSGSGKSSLLAFVAGFLDSRVFAAEGAVLVDGDNVSRKPPEKRRIGLLFQDDLLFPHLSVGGNLMFGLSASIRDHDERRRLVEAALADAGLEGFAERDPATLSGGQRARVALMRVLLSQPRALLLDEPFSKLDTELRGSFRTMVFDQARRRGLPVLLVTHDPQDAEAANGRVVTL